MNAISFCQSVKNDVITHTPKKKCCARTFRDASNALTSGETSEFERAYDSLKCGDCVKEFIRAAFLILGNVTDPEREYHFEITSRTKEELEVLKKAFNDAGMTPGETVRQEKYVLYFKDSGIIEDVLAFIGANRAAFEVMNSKIVKEFRNNTNRAVNCDTANISKTLSAAQRCLDAITKLRESGGLSRLTPELAEAARLREEYPSASITELGKYASPPVTKSGMNHRLERIIRAAEKENLTKSDV